MGATPHYPLVYATGREDEYRPRVLDPHHTMALIDDLSLTQ
jgi:hypothetical protein